MYKFEDCVYIIILKDLNGNMGYTNFRNTEEGLKAMENFLNFVEDMGDYELIGWVKIDLQTLDVDIKRNNDIIEEEGGD